MSVELGLSSEEKVFEKRALRKTLGPKMEEVTQSCKKLIIISITHQISLS
jgi:hypothetical protein